MNGPVPDGTVVKVALWLGQTIRLTKSLAVVRRLTVSVALLVALVQTPVTSTVYVPVSLVLSDVSVSDDVDWPPMTLPFFFHTYVNGPVPDTASANPANVPEQLFVMLVNPLELAGMFTVSNALFVTELQVAVTITL